jgi:hypothetical protein
VGNLISLAQKEKGMQKYKKAKGKEWEKVFLVSSKIHPDLAFVSFSLAFLLVSPFGNGGCF